jgi:hypothetical protein
LFADGYSTSKEMGMVEPFGASWYVFGGVNHLPTIY